MKQTMFEQLHLNTSFRYVGIAQIPKTDQILDQLQSWDGCSTTSLLANMFQKEKFHVEMAEAKTSSTRRVTTSPALSSNDLAALGLQEVIRYFWFGINELGLLSMLSVRVHEAARNGRAWRRAVRAMFPHHPFEVDVDTCFRHYSIRYFLFNTRRINIISTTFSRAHFENLASKYLPQCSQTGARSTVGVVLF